MRILHSIRFTDSHANKLDAAYATSLVSGFFTFTDRLERPC
jgi:hypothetical protein